jgi:hypothetical protein
MDEKDVKEKAAETDAKEETSQADQELVGLLDSLDEQPNKPEPAPKPPEEKPLKAPEPVPTSAVTTTVQEEKPPGPDIGAILANFCEIRDEIFGNFRNDRKQTAEILQKFEEQIKEGAVTTAVLEAYVSTLRIRTDINTNAISMLDSITRLLAAGKNNSVFVQNSAMTPQDLEKILKAPPMPDEQ